MGGKKCHQTVVCFYLRIVACAFLMFNRKMNVVVVIIIIRTDAVDEQTGQDQVEDVEKWAAPHFDDVGDVRIRFRTAAVVLFVVDRLEIDQIKLAVRLIIADVTFIRLFLQVNLRAIKTRIGICGRKDKPQSFS